MTSKPRFKLSPQQSTLIRLVNSKPDGHYYPRRRDYLEGKMLLLGEQGLDQVVNSLISRGLVIPGHLGKWSMIITDSGRDAAAQEQGKPLAWVFEQKSQSLDEQ